MSVEVTARHMNAPAAKQHAKERAEKLEEMFPRVEHVRVVLDVEKHRCEAEFIVRAKNHIHIEASEVNNDSDMIAAIDVAFERAERQLRKLRDKVQEHRVNGDEVVEPPV